MTETKPLNQHPPRTAAIVAVVMPGPPAYLQIDLFDTQANSTDRIIARYTTNPDNVIEAASAFELLLSGTLWGQPHNMKGLELPNVGRA
jgi:hypothetical protein